MRIQIKAIIALLALSAGLVSCHKPRDYDYSRFYVDPAGAGGGRTITVMTFNVRAASSVADVGERAWAVRRAGVKEMLASTSPVLMGAQECDFIQRQNIIEDDPRYAAIGINLDGPKEECEECAIFYMKDSVQVLSHGTFYLTSTPNLPSRMAGVGHYRACTWGKMKMVKGGQEFYHFNTHLEYSAAFARQPEMEILLEQVKKINTEGLPIFMTGDWNTDEDDAIFKDIKSYGFESARLEAIIGDSYKTCNNYGDYGSGLTLDHCWFKGFAGVTRFITIKDKYAGLTYISDHYPVSITLKF